MKLDLTVGADIFSDDKVLLIHHRKLNIWIPVGGHIEPNETPDEAVQREVGEETGLDIELFQQSYLPEIGNVKENKALPFYANVHSVGDHDHYCLYYVCKTPDASKMSINTELKDARWFLISELGEKIVPPDVKEQALAAYKIFLQK